MKKIELVERVDGLFDVVQSVGNVVTIEREALFLGEAYTWSLLLVAPGDLTLLLNGVHRITL